MKKIKNKNKYYTLSNGNKYRGQFSSLNCKKFQLQGQWRSARAEFEVIRIRGNDTIYLVNTLMGVNCFFLKKEYIVQFLLLSYLSLF